MPAGGASQGAFDPITIISNDGGTYCLAKRTSSVKTVLVLRGIEWEVFCSWSRSAGCGDLPLRPNHHRLEAGGFDSRLKARLLWVQDKSKTPKILAHSTLTEFVGQPGRPSSVQRTASGRLKARDFRSQSETLNVKRKTKVGGMRRVLLLSMMQRTRRERIRRKCL